VTEGPAQPPSLLLASAGAALGRDFEPVVVRLPDSAGLPAQVTAREKRRAEGRRPQLMTVYLDPATARVLGVAEFRNSLVGFLHRFHENLTIPEYNGRSIVGWTGVAMLVMSLSGIYLWWPRNVGFLHGLRWRRGPHLSFNLHHLFGFWISIPLAVVSATGIYLGFPQQGRDLLGAIVPLTPPQRGSFNAPLLAIPHIDVDRALEIARGANAGAQPVAIFLPAQQTQIWRVQLRSADGEMTKLVDDRSGVASPSISRTGDGIAQWIRWTHEGSHAGAYWRVIVFLCGILPTVFVVTGTMIWLRTRRPTARAERSITAVPQIDAAE
jgi:uncharacterized iron-regulated membrane protein